MSLTSRDMNLWRQLYLSMVRPHLEYAVQVWSPYKLKNINEIERVQARATKVPTNLQQLPYEKRLELMKITSLKERRTRGDIIQFYKSLNGIDQIDWIEDIKYRPSSNAVGPSSGLRGHKLRVERQSFNSRIQNDFCHFVETRHNFFLNRVAPSWNSLPEEVVGSKTVNTFKNLLDHHTVKAAMAHQ